MQGFAGLPWAGITYGGSDGLHVYCADAACVADHLEAEGSTPVEGAVVIHLVKDLVLPELRLLNVRDKTVEGHGHRLKFVRGTRKSLFVLHACQNLVFRGLYLPSHADVRAVRIVRRRRDVVLRHEGLEHLRLRRPQAQTLQSQEHGRSENSTRGLPGHLQYLLIHPLSLS